MNRALREAIRIAAISPFLAIGLLIGVPVIATVGLALCAFHKCKFKTIGFDSSQDFKYEQKCEGCGELRRTNDPEDGLIKKITNTSL